MLIDGDMVQAHHRHGFYYLLAIARGEGSHEIDFVKYPIRDSSVFFLRPGQVHQLMLKKGSTGYLMSFGTDFYRPHDQGSTHTFREARNKNFCSIDSDRFEGILGILSQIFREFTQREDYYQDVIKANLSILFVELVRNRRSVEARANPGSLYTQQRFEEFLDLVAAHVFEEKKVSYYAERLNLSSYQLNALTKASLGKTASEVIDEHIVLESKRHLLATSSQVNQIAHHLGYEDPSYFIRFFKKHTGHSPETFRNKFK